MSHIVQAKAKIKIPSAKEQPAQHQAALALLTQAVQLVAGQHQGGQVTDYHLDWYRKKRPVELAIITDGLTRGMAIVVDPTSGELTFVGDFWGVTGLAQQIQQEIVQAYTVLSLQEVLAQQGYLVQAEEGAEQGQIVLRGVTYAA